MTFEQISPDLLDETPKEVIAMAYAASRDSGHAIAENIDDAIRMEWAMAFVRGHTALKPPFDTADYFVEADAD